MNRAVLAALAVLAVVAVVVVGSRGSGDDGRQTVAAVFDSAQGIVSGQLVKIAGARAGRIDRVDLLPGRRYRARLVLDLDEGTPRFREDASCQLLPEGLISEKFVDCDPGSPDAKVLPDGEDGMPEVTDTATPLNLQDVLNIFSAPTSKRVGVLLSELGIATAGRGDDINALIRRTNPALEQADRVLEVMAGQRREIADSITQTDRVLATLGRDEREITRFLDGSADVLNRTSARREALGDAIEAMPPLLQAADKGLTSLSTAMTASRPFLRDLDRAGGDLSSFVRRTGDFSEVARPAARAVAKTARDGRPALTPLRKRVKEFKALGQDAAEPLKDLGDLMASIRDSGGWNGLMRTIYGLAVGAATRDNNSHFYGAVINLFPLCILVPPHIVPVPGCDHSYDSPQRGRIPINDPLVRPAQRRAFITWLRAGGMDKTPAWLRSSVPALVEQVAKTLKVDVDQILGRKNKKKTRTPRKPAARPKLTEKLQQTLPALKPRPDAPKLLPKVVEDLDTAVDSVLGSTQRLLKSLLGGRP